MTDRHPPKPLTPTLSAAFTRSSTKSPLTPKLARPSYPTSKRFTQSEHPASSPSRDDLTPSLLSANVTPRSGSRTSRRDGISSPTNTPSATTNPSPQSAYSQPIASPGSAHAYRTDRSQAQGGRLDPRNARAKTLTSENFPRSNSIPYDTATPRFFHASDVRSNVDSDPRSKAKSPPSFFYANGQEQERLQVESNATIPATKRRSTGAPRPISVAKPSAASSPRLRSPNQVPDDLRSQTARHSDDSPQRALQFHPQLHSSSLTKLPDGPPPLSIGRHIKSTSLDSAQSNTPTREGLRPSPVIISPSESNVDAVDSEQTHPLRPRIFSHGSSASADTHTSIQSPGKSEGASPCKPDPALNARTERKILDLEISNSSLLAINRTLEREMRRQNAELRRYRRLSRSGRLSMAPTNRSVSGGGLSVTSEADEVTSELSIPPPDDISDVSDDDSVDEDALSPDSLAEHDAKQQARDEKRFYIDLAKHQEVLVTSQKMDQSIRRCLGWTEELITEGRKALEYRVNVSDVELGGRVLAPEELAEMAESNRGLLSPSYEIPASSPNPIDPIDPTDPTDPTDPVPSA